MNRPTKQKFLLGLLCVALVLGNLSCTKKSPEGSSGDLNDSTKVLQQTADEYWDYLQEESIYLRLKAGLKITKLPDISYAYAKTQQEKAAAVLEKLNDVIPADLTHEDKLSFGVLKWNLETAIEGLKYYDLTFPVTPYASALPLVHRVFTTYNFAAEQDLADYQVLLRQYARLIIQFQEKLSTQQEKGIVLPKAELALVIPFHKTFLKKGEQSLFFVSQDRLGAWETQIVERFLKQVAAIVDTEIYPALESLVAFMSGDYLTHASETVGLWQYPNGAEYYRYLIKVNTTLELTPEEIHQLGLENVTSNNQELDKIREQVDFKGTLDEFRNFLKTDQRFFPSSAEQIDAKLNGYIAGMEKHIDDYFLRKPKAPYGVARLAPELEASMTFGYYEPPSQAKPKGTYYYNGSNPEQRSLLISEGLVYHELVPGHHFHVAAQYENEDIPAFRQETLYNSFNEGWAEYASWLGREMGLFQDPYSLAGRYMTDNFFSVRLVVDTGMNHLQWTRDKAVQFMRDNLLESDTQIHTETLRYSSDIQAQALAYKLGSLKMFELRKKTEAALGDRFDVRKFHEAILGSGSLPFPILDKHIEWFIQQELK